MIELRPDVPRLPRCHVRIGAATGATDVSEWGRRRDIALSIVLDLRCVECRQPQVRHAWKPPSGRGATHTTVEQQCGSERHSPDGEWIEGEPFGTSDAEP
jgi:hypothetical protein